MRLLLVYNPNARLAKRVGPYELAQELRRLGAEVEIACTISSEETVAITAQAVESGINRVVAAGGDGTISAVIDALALTQVPLAVIPLGTGNVLAAEAGLRTGRWRQACRVAVGDVLRRIDLGRAGKRYFATMFGAGIDAQVVVDVAARDKLNYGRLAFVGQLLSTLFRSRPIEFAVTIDEKRHCFVTWSIIICNTARYAWRLHFTPEASPTDGVLNLCSFQPASRLGVMAQGLACFLFQCRRLSPGVKCFVGRRMFIDASVSVPWQADGEIGGTTPVEIELVPSALTVAVRDCTCALAKEAVSVDYRRT
jgi:YegS/Rv2252/BmrU family lipid kinase